MATRLCIQFPVLMTHELRLVINSIKLNQLSQSEYLLYLCKNGDIYRIVSDHIMRR